MCQFIIHTFCTKRKGAAINNICRAMIAKGLKSQRLLGVFLVYWGNLQTTQGYQVHYSGLLRRRTRKSFIWRCTGATGHTESVQIEFDPKIIPFGKILDIFWHRHNPTTLNRQGNDVGTQYRSAIFYHDLKQKAIAEKSKEELEKQGLYKNPVVTEITPFKNFYVAEDYHKNYYEEHQDAPYCNLVIDPKIQKLLLNYRNDVRDEYKQ